MKRTTVFATLAIAFAASATALGISAAVDTPRTLMSRDDYQDARRGIEASTREALSECRSLDAAAARQICRAKAQGDERVKKAQLQARYEGTVSAASEIEVARIRAQYDLDRARCTTLASGERFSCVRSAREARAREIHEARLASTT